MAARYLRNTTLGVAESDVQDSAIVVGKNIQSILIVTNNDNNNHMSAQIQGMLCGVSCTLNSIQSQNKKANEE
jgi:predicted nuclease of predicted toxin-antitoxin system